MTKILHGLAALVSMAAGAAAGFGFLAFGASPRKFDVFGSWTELAVEAAILTVLVVGVAKVSPVRWRTRAGSRSVRPRWRAGDTSRAAAPSCSPPPCW